MLVQRRAHSGGATLNCTFRSDQLVTSGRDRATRGRVVELAFSHQHLWRFPNDRISQDSALRTVDLMLPAITMETEASHMLEAALEQIDDIIAGSKAAAMELSTSVYDLGTPVNAYPLQLAEELKLALEVQPNQEERDNLRAQLPPETAQALINWLQTGTVSCSPANNETYQERLLRLEGDKESLVLQVSVLTDQVEAQGEKIRDLETSLEEHRQKLASTEEMLQQELMSRTSLETQKLDLMDEVSYLKLKLVTMEETRTNTNPQDAADTKNNKAEDLLQEVKHLTSKVQGLEGEKSLYERKLRATKAEISEMQQLLASKDTEIECLQTQLLARGSSTNNNAEREEVYIKQLLNKYQEYQRLKVGMESLLASNDEKDRRIEELTVLLGQYRKMKEVMALTHGSSEEELSGTLKLKAITHKAHSDMIRSEISSRGSSPLMLSSSPFQRDLDSSFQNSVDTSFVTTGYTSLINGSLHRHRLLSSSLEELQSGSFQKALEIQPVETESDVGAESPQMELSKYQTLPGKLGKKKEPKEELNGPRGRDTEYLSPVQLSPSHSREYTLIRCRSASAPALDHPAELEERMLSDQSPLSSGLDSGQQSPVSPEKRKNHRGIKKLWGRIRRSQSGSPVQLHDPELGDFKRGGFRATAGPRLARPGKTRDLKLPFSKWNTEQVCDWLEDIGLGQYALLAQQWVSSGQTLLAAAPHDLEKELSMKNPLHRKKLQLSLKNVSSKQQEKSAELDYIWVTRWLDDIGLPQYKDQFNDGRVDGQMLQYLTVNDLLFLKVTSQLHHLSLKCAIHVLHVNKFNPNCLKRRPGNECEFSPSEVVQWSNHRVMEWLRSVDLAEYAPNLRGSGVHGGLIMLEPRFNSDTMAMLLNISPQKTLLRRHLNTNFNNLVGVQAQQEKKEYTEAAGYSPLSITAKVKPKKLGFSNLTGLRRRRTDESTDYICPVESSSPESGQSVANGVQMRPYTGFRGLSPILDRELPRDQMVNAESTILEIEALSESINNLTVSTNTHELLLNGSCSLLPVVCSNRSSNLSDGNFS
ncbi:liprin-beta-2b isoform X12 [Cyprinodon tularosa]|uniref:liprin-beta-2b isoform X12 n=1 Tax=Cyprinodon tularosa TaxID=77115 RepID=UPI0018E24FD9|nr:liprin-beta-2b isoform X12 [Cyprinodon tularosa]